MYSLSELENTFDEISSSSEDGISGVLSIKSGESGPVLGITACTHGNEPAGLAVFKYLLDGIRSREIKLTSGEIYLVINNIQATKNFFEASAQNNETLTTRYVDVNMNRLPKDVMCNNSDRRYESMRARELYPIWSKFTHALDIHSTPLPGDPMIISRGGIFYSDLVQDFPIDIFISNIDSIQLGAPAFSFYGGKNSKLPVFAIEAGQNIADDTFPRAIACTAALLRNVDLIEVDSVHVKPRVYHEFTIADSVIFPDGSFEFAQKFTAYQSVKKGDILARSKNGEEIQMPFDGHILLIMPFKYPGEEMAFLSKPVLEHNI